MIKKLLVNRYIKNYVIFILSFSLLEFIFRFVEGYSIFSYSVLRIFIGLNFLSIIFSIFSSMFPLNISKIINCIIIIIFGIYGFVELGFHNFLGSYVSLQVKSQAEAVSSYIKDFFLSFKIHYYLLLIPIILLIIYYIISSKKDLSDLYIVDRKKGIIISTFKIMLFAFLVLLYGITMKVDFMQNKLQSITNIELFKKPNNPALTISEFGYIAYGLLDIKEYIFPYKEEEINIDFNQDDILKEEAIIENEEQKEEPLVEKVYTNQVTLDNSLWLDLINREKNQTLNNLNKYFISSNVTKTNDYTGVFKDKNLIVIMVESGSNIMLDEAYFPNIAKIYKNGWKFPNYYSPRNSCSTGNSEVSAMVSLYPGANRCTVNSQKNNSYFESIFNLFNDLGYETNSFHDHYDRFYDRTTIHPNMGSNKFYKVQDMGINYSEKYGHWADDGEMIKFYLKKLDERDLDGNFMSWITTVTMHQPYTFGSEPSSRYLKSYSNLPREMQFYYSKTKVFDDALGILLNGLDQRGILEDTVIAIFCDHYPYAIPTNILNNYFSYDLNVDFNADNVPFLIYNKKMEEMTIDNYATYVDITPTLANLFALKFDSRIYMGSDILSSEHESIAVFPDGSWKNKDYLYDSSKNRVKTFGNIEVNNDYIAETNEKIKKKLKFSEYAFNTNYFNYLNKNLK